MKKMMALDANSLLNRSFYGVRALSNSKGFPTNAIYGFYGKLVKLLKEFRPDAVVAAFDLKAKTFRHKQFELYKAGRKPMPHELFLQLAEVKKMLKLMGIYICEKEGFEADDLLGTISRICSNEQVECIIVSGDRDVLQLVSEKVKVVLATNKSDILFDEAAVVEQFGVCAKQLIEVKALMGDSSDNIPGVKGIGEKTALKLISKYNNIAYIFENLNTIDVSVRVRNLLSSDEAKKMCYLSKELGTICLFAGLDENLNTYLKKEVDFEGLKSFLEQFELKKYLKSLNELKEPTEAKPFCSNQKFDGGVEQKFEVFVDLNLNEASLKLQSATELKFFFYDDFLFIVHETLIFKFEKLKLQAFKALVVESEKPKITTDLKKVYGFCFLNGLSAVSNVVFSCDLASYLNNVLAKSHDLKTLAESFFGSTEPEKCFSKVCNILKQKLDEQNLVFLFKEVELPLSRVLAEMEVCGFCVDKAKLVSFGKFLNERINLLKSKIWSECGEQFNINSTKELSNILFNKLKLPKTKKTKTGYSTDAESLLKLVKHSNFVNLILKYREKAKLYSTYVLGLQKVIGSDGRIHSSFNQTQTRTGRISSLEPNIQNIPIKTELGSEMRKCFVAKEGCVLVDGDYSQIELRILAAMAGDEEMIEAFKCGQDIHRLTASRIFNVGLNEVGEELRRRAKTVNFSVIYGIGAFSLAKSIGVSIDSAKSYIDSFFVGYEKIKAYFDEVVESAKKTGEVRTMFGRIRKVPELSSVSKKTVALGERIAKNTPIQGTCADLIKIAMINVSKKLKQKNLKANLILQVHDELLIESQEGCAQEVKQILKTEMENVANLSVPLVAKISIGKTWFDC